ncbi:LptF/LptG family permease [Candidatus Bandiella euplotis]|uniref:LptF/LptG family ABC transporter permease n=1 Tax=Candidatus Bandiella euplotis TaxID=1664265 RepID=A0ABZ0UN53_9RICK|nr:LptF/LptG family permease [Candidatus Bandiella woodruffii]WPX96513.1 LptF/LptG family ABC transporter permease [Candidatus Bandiella woodruffii]
MVSSKTYFKRNFVDYFKTLFFTLAAFFLIILLFDLLEILRITSKYSLKLPVLIKLALMKNYSSLRQVVPMIVLVSSLIFFYIKNKNNEIIAAKSVGMSSFNIIIPVLSAVLVFGIINVVLINPVGTMFLRKYQNYEAHKFKKQVSLIAVSKSGIWLKNKLGEDDVIINALRVSQAFKTMHDTNIFIIDKTGALQKQVSAKKILLMQDEIIAEDATLIDRDFEIQSMPTITLPIQISISQIFENLTSIETISFFQLLEFIKIADDSGLSSTKYIMQFLKEVFSPIFLISMAMVSYFYCYNVSHRKKLDLSPLFCLVTGFTIYFSTNFVHALGSSGQISVILAVLFPVITFNTLISYLMFRKN